MNPLGQWEAATVGGPDGGRTRYGNTAPLQTAIAHTRTGEVIRAPFQPGDRIYVRETWRGVVNIAPPGFYEYAVARYVPDQEHCRRVEYAATQEADGEPWQPAIHMPKWAARIWLEVTGVRVERLQEITPDNCIAEGAWPAEQRELGRGHEAVSAFRELWESTGGDWDANPWVWVVDFKVLRVLSTTGRPA